MHTYGREYISLKAKRFYVYLFPSISVVRQRFMEVVALSDWYAIDIGDLLEEISFSMVAVMY